MCLPDVIRIRTSTFCSGFWRKQQKSHSWRCWRTSFKLKDREKICPALLQIEGHMPCSGRDVKWDKLNHRKASVKRRRLMYACVLGGRTSSNKLKSNDRGRVLPAPRLGGGERSSTALPVQMALPVWTSPSPLPFQSSCLEADEQLQTSVGTSWISPL